MEAHKDENGMRRYGNWAGNPEGQREDPTRCIEEVRVSGMNFPHYHQCSRKRGHGPDGLYCKQHDPEVAAKRQAVVDQRAEEKYQKMRKEWSGPRFYTVLKQIAEGHNDPRTLAKKAIDGFKD